MLFNFSRVSKFTKEGNKKRETRKASPWVRVILVNTPPWGEAIVVAAGILKDSSTLVVCLVHTQALSWCPVYVVADESSCPPQEVGSNRFPQFSGGAEKDE